MSVFGLGRSANRPLLHLMPLTADCVCPRPSDECLVVVLLVRLGSFEGGSFCRRLRNEINWQRLGEYLSGIAV